MNKNITEIYNLIQDLSWYFGNQGFNGECCGDLSLVEYMAVKKIHDTSDISIQEIGNLLNMTKSGASKIINRLESKGYVEREKSSADGRVCCVAITDKGKDAITKIVEQYTDYVSKMFRGFEPESVDNAKNILEAMLMGARKQGFIKSN